MSDLVEFLEARIDDDEYDANRELLLGTTTVLTRMNSRILAECAAKRAVIVLAQKAAEAEREFDDYEWQGTVKRREPLAGDAILYALAAVYKDHPDYQEEWAA